MRKLSKIGTVALVLYFLTPLSAVFSQQSKSIASALSGFKSPDPQRRQDAYYSIKDNREALQRANVQKDLIELMDRENGIYNDPKAAYGEGYVEYVSDLGETVGGFADWRDAKVVCSLAHSPAYSGNAGHLTALADELIGKAAKIALPCLLKMAHGTPGENDSAIPMLLKAAAVTPDLPQADQQKIFQTVTDALHDPDPDMRLSAVMASDTLGTSDLIPVLRDIARSDPYTNPEDTKHFPIREAAANALHSIEQRSDIH